MNYIQTLLEQLSRVQTAQFQLQQVLETNQTALNYFSGLYLSKIPESLDIFYKYYPIAVSLILNIYPYAILGHAYQGYKITILNQVYEMQKILEEFTTYYPHVDPKSFTKAYQACISFKSIAIYWENAILQMNQTQNEIVTVRASYDELKNINVELKQNIQLKEEELENEKVKINQLTELLKQQRHSSLKMQYNLREAEKYHKFQTEELIKNIEEQRKIAKNMADKYSKDRAQYENQLQLYKSDMKEATQKHISKLIQVDKDFNEQKNVAIQVNRRLQQVMKERQALQGQKRELKMLMKQLSESDEKNKVYQKKYFETEDRYTKLLKKSKMDLEDKTYKNEKLDLLLTKQRQITKSQKVQLNEQKTRAQLFEKELQKLEILYKKVEEESNRYKKKSQLDKKEIKNLKKQISQLTEANKKLWDKSSGLVEQNQIISSKLEDIQVEFNALKFKQIKYKRIIKYNVKARDQFKKELKKLEKKYEQGEKVKSIILKQAQKVQNNNEMKMNAIEKDVKGIEHWINMKNPYYRLAYWNRIDK